VVSVRSPLPPDPCPEVLPAEPIILGWREWLSLPELGLPRIKAKIDTGARTSSLQAFDVQPFDRLGVEWVRFGVHPRQYRRDVVTTCEAMVKDRRSITDSGGHEELRYVIDTVVRIGGATWSIEMSLASRDDLRFRLLLGRSAIAGKAVVDPERSYLTRRQRTPRKAR
jgi:hypothetical protein